LMFEATNLFNWFMQFCEFINHFSIFSNANRMMSSLNVCSRISSRLLQNRFSV
jgi:hypothetical protein